MIGYELKKIFGKRKCIALLVVFSIITFFITFVMCRIGYFYDYGTIPFEEYLSYYWLYGMANLYIIIFVHVSFFPIEEKTNMSQIFMTSQFGRENLAKTKIILALIFTNTLVILFIVSSLIGYSVAFDLNFNIPIIEEYTTIYVRNSCVNTSGEMLLLNMIAFFITANFTALCSMYLAAKIRNVYLVCIFLFAACFMTLFSLNPEVGIFFSILPLGNYIVIADALKEIFSIGHFAVTPYFISLVFTCMLICILLIKIKKIYKTVK